MASGIGDGKVRRVGKIKQTPFGLKNNLVAVELVEFTNYGEKTIFREYPDNQPKRIADSIRQMKRYAKKHQIELIEG